MEVKHKLIAEVLKHWRSAPEERALAEAILYMTGLHLTDLQKLSVQEVTDILVDVIRRPEAKRQVQNNSKEVQGQKAKEQEDFPSEEESLLSLEEAQGEPEPEIKTPETPPLSYIEMKKLKRGRPRVEKETN